MAVISANGVEYPEWVQLALNELASEYPGRDFWYVGSYAGLDSWSSRPIGESVADMVHFSPGAIRAALEEASDG